LVLERKQAQCFPAALQFCSLLTNRLRAETGLDKYIAQCDHQGLYESQDNNTFLLLLRGVALIA
jgi:hypothetical protein